MNRLASRSVVLTMALAIAASGAAADYWSYQHQEFDVVAQGSAAYAQSIARQLDALNHTLQKLLSRDANAAAPPTRIYALRPEDYAPIKADWAEAGGAFFRSGPFDHVLVVPSENEGPNAKRGAYAAQARAWLDDQGLARLPDWFKHGFGLMVGAANFDNDQLTLGQEIPAYVARLKQTGWISVEYLLFLPSDDMRFHKSPEMSELYDAECWWLTHIALLDGTLEKMMSGYLALLIQGQDPATAFATGFNTDFESLDKFLKKLRRTVTLRRHQSAIAPAGAAAIEPSPVDATELKARMAQLAVLYESQSTPGQQWATEALQQAPDNESALLALMEQRLVARQFQPLLAGMSRLQQLASLSARGHASVAVVQITLARLRDNGVQGIGDISANELRAAARVHLRRARELDESHPLPVYALGWLLASQGDVLAIKQLLPGVEQVYYQRPYSVELAQLLLRLHTLTGDTEAQFKFAVAMRRLAETPLDRNAAQKRIDRLRPGAKAALTP
jgi:hypothetical protein